MTRVLAAAVSALFLGAVITEIHSRLFPGRYVPLLILSVVAIFIGSIVTSRVAARTEAAEESDGTEVVSESSRRRPRNRTGEVVQPHQRVRLHHPRRWR